MNRPALLLCLARSIAKAVHDGQTYGAGPYMHHVDRVAYGVARLGPRAQTLAYLHDVVEDSPVTWRCLEALGFPEDLVDDVLALSRNPREHYASYIERVIAQGSDEALQVKLSDLGDNMDDWVSPALFKRYTRADFAIREALRLKGVEPLFYVRA